MNIFRSFVAAILVMLMSGACGCLTSSSEAPSGTVGTTAGSDVATGYQPIQSDLIFSVRYDEEEGMLTVVLYEDGVYDYALVPRTVYDEFLDAKDHDAFYTSQIKAKFKGKKFSMDTAE